MHTPPLIQSLRNALTSFALAVAVLTAAAAGGSADAPPGPDPTAVEFLIASSARDFKISGANRPTAIRAARIGFFAESGRGVYLLCGSFKSGAGSQAEWIHFATIKTSDYEQWLGGAAKAYCEQPKIKWYSGDHSAALEKSLKY